MGYVTEASTFAKEYGVSSRKITRLGGLQRLLAMSPEARAALLNGSKLLVSNNELHRGGLGARGFKVWGKRA